jgi:hypothetical protein
MCFLQCYYNNMIFWHFYNARMHSVYTISGFVMPIKGQDLFSGQSFPSPCKPDKDYNRFPIEEQDTGQKNSMSSCHHLTVVQANMLQHLQVAELFLQQLYRMENSLVHSDIFNSLISKRSTSSL